MKRIIEKRDIPFLGLWMFGVGALLWFGTRVHWYLVEVAHLPLPQPYPWDGVRSIAATMTAELVILYVIVRPRTYARSWFRALVASLVCVSLVVFWAQFFMHAPPYIVWHWLWLTMTTAGMFALFVISVVRSFPRRQNLSIDQTK